MAKNTIEKTNVMRILDQKKAVYKAYSFETDRALSGTEVAEKLQIAPENAFKTLVTVGRSGEHYVFVIPVAEELHLKKAAAAVGEKNIEMIPQKELLPLTGYVHGGCSPVGMKKFFKTVIHVSAAERESILFSGGKIGYHVELSLEELKKVISFDLEDIIK